MEKPSQYELDVGLIKAVRSGNIREIKKFLRKGANPNTTSPRLDTSPLQYAVAYGDLNRIKLLINWGADIKQRDKNGQTVLYRFFSCNTDQHLIAFLSLVGHYGAKLDVVDNLSLIHI